jgi:phospholipase/carboxylesterase
MSRRLPKRSAAGRRRGRPSPNRAPAGAGGGSAGEDCIFTPLGYEPGYAYPLLVWLPDTGPGPRRPGFDLGRTMQGVSLRNFIAVQPAASAAEFRALGVDGVVWRAIDRVRRRVSVSRRRVFLVGSGAAGTDAFRVACRHARDFAGVVSLGGRFPLDESLFAALADVRRLPMLLCCHRDAVLESAAHTDRMLRLFHAAGAALAMRIYPESDDLAPPILADVNRWLMDEVCGTTATQPAFSAS